MKILIRLFFVPTCLLICCTSKNIKRITLDGQIIEGIFLPGNVINGYVNVYDSATNLLIETANYNNGVLDGERTTLYPNGYVKARVNYSVGKENGNLEVYDSLGHLLNTQFRYYGLRVGPSINFIEGKPKQYWFYSFDNAVLSYINYDSILNKKISEIQMNFFPFRSTQFQIDNFNDTIHFKSEYFLYLMNPPKYNFQYSLCIVNDSFRVIKELRKFDSHTIWDTFEIDTSQLKNAEHYALKIRVDDSTHEERGAWNGFKKIN
jgi:hypothetical protein